VGGFFRLHHVKMVCGELEDKTILLLTVAMDLPLYLGTGFIMMCPQLFINYKLKSVAHMPWRQMTYKFLNTIIDDLFAFVIKMPTLHRLSVFRDGKSVFILLKFASMACGLCNIVLYKLCPGCHGN
jgi:hypothetical protein